MPIGIKSTWCKGQGEGHEVAMMLFGTTASTKTGHLIPVSQMLPIGVCMGCAGTPSACCSKPKKPKLNIVA